METIDRVTRLNTAAARRVIEPDEEITGHIGPGQLLPDELLTVAGLDLDLSADQRRTLSREEMASIVSVGIRFEAMLEAGFGAHAARMRDLTDPRLTFILHEVGEETRHQRLFQRLLSQLDPQAGSPIPFAVVAGGYRVVTHLVVDHLALFHVLVLGGEEIPDLFQRVASAHPDTDPFVKDVNRYHRMEEARHLSYARAVFPEVWDRAHRLDRRLVRRLAPRAIRVMFDTMVHPGVYAAAGLPAFATWRQANRAPQRTQLRWQATRPILDVLIEAGAVRRGRVPAGWRSLCGVDRRGDALPDIAPAW